MTATPARSASAPPTATAPSGQLAGGVLGLPSVLFCIVTGAAPLAAMLFNVPVATLGGGYASPAAFAVATVALTIFSVGYIAMARRVTAAGGFYTFVTRGLGRVLGLGTGLLIAVCYMVFSSAVTGVTGYFASTTVASLTGLDLPAWVYMIVGLVLMTMFAYFHIELTAKVLGVLLIGEVLVLLIMAIGVFAAGGAEGFSLAPLNPVNIFNNSAAIGVFGAGAAGIALFAAFWSWVGFEMAPNYAEETRDPHKIAKTATYGSVIGLGVFYVVISYAFVTGWGLNGSATAVQSQFNGEIASAFYPLTDRYVGGWATVLMEILIVTGSFACAMAFYNTSARYLFSLGREGVLPSALARTSSRQSPAVASITVTVLVALYCLAFVIYDPSTEGALLKLGTWSPLLGMLGILGVQALVSVAIIRYFLTTGRRYFSVWSTLIAPVLGCAAMIVASWLLISNRGDLAGAADALYIQLLPWVVLLIFLLGMGVALALRARAPDRYHRIGQFELTEGVVP
ncbi:MAG TPA: APC family permease [Pseudonocardia sp.]|nr:APC family permease [Pseudonocardia sp.]